MRSSPVLLLIALASCAEPAAAPASEPPIAEGGPRVALHSAAIPRRHFLDELAPCHDRAARDPVRFSVAVRALQRFDREHDAWEPIEVSTDAREAICRAPLPMAPTLLGLASLPLDETYFVVLDVDGRVEGHLVATRLTECADAPPGSGALPEGRAMACVAGPDGSSWIAVPDPRRIEVCTGPCRSASLALTAHRRRPPLVLADASMTPQLRAYTGDTYEGDPPYALRAVSLVRLTEDRERWVSVSLARTDATTLDPSHPLDLGEWLGVRLEPHRTYALRTRVDGEIQDVWIMVSELICNDIMLEPPEPPGRVAACVATARGALATYVPSPGPALDRASDE